MAPALGVALTRVIGGSAIFPHRVAAETLVSCLRSEERKRTAELGAHSRCGLIAHVELGAAEVTLVLVLVAAQVAVRDSALQHVEVNLTGDVIHAVPPAATAHHRRVAITRHVAVRLRRRAPFGVLVAAETLRPVLHTKVVIPRTHVCAQVRRGECP